MKRMEKTSLDNVNTVHQLANLFWKLNKFRQTLMCSMCVTQSVTITFSESLFKTICQRSDFNVHQSVLVRVLFSSDLEKTAAFSVYKRKSISIYLSPSCNLASSCAHATLETSCIEKQSSIFGVLRFLTISPSTNSALAFLVLACVPC